MHFVVHCVFSAVEIRDAITIQVVDLVVCSVWFVIDTAAVLDGVITSIDKCCTCSGLDDSTICL